MAFNTADGSIHRCLEAEINKGDLSVDYRYRRLIKKARFAAIRNQQKYLKYVLRRRERLVQFVS